MALLERLRALQEDEYPQFQSRLFRLPIELRTVVYCLVYPENILHLKENFGAVERKGLHCSAYWCIALNDYEKGYSHTPCDLFEKTKKQMLGLPLTCRRLYLETIQYVYSRHTMHFSRETFALQWLRHIPKTHLDAITSVRLSGLYADSQEYKDVWETLSLLPNLQKLVVKIAGFDVHDSWDCNMPEEFQEEISAPIKIVQQSTIQSFDIIVEIGSTWFPDDYYLRLDYNRLNWDTFSFDRGQFPTLFDGIHPRCRVIGMNGFILNRPLVLLPRRVWCHLSGRV
ncbi:hypothetical protein NQ176_g7028 [Zarea fungicola]|uniref:Uncharacterized protein n=1 Tax=Zarea fungicola TaxID=93591 RepID=A0ACC1N2I6_9HYPO|nr:hypothetical protein NQ176_g7028 [Lecanicillium fungicola]